MDTCLVQHRREPGAEPAMARATAVELSGGAGAGGPPVECSLGPLKTSL